MASGDLIDHLTELRTRLIRSFISILIAAALSWFFIEPIFDAIRRPIAPYLPSGGLVFTNPVDLFFAHMKVALLAGVVLSAPFWLFQIWRFISPGLYAHEKRYSVVFIFFGTLLFLTGLAFVYFLVLPTAFKFLLNLGGGIDKPMITVSEYMSFFITTTLIFGTAFELPLILTMLGILGVIDSAFLAGKRRIAIVLLSILSAVVTPPDALSMMMLLVPLYLLYELSIILVRIFGRKKVDSE